MPNRVPLDAKTARWLPWVVAIAFFMQSLDGTILNTALPAMARDLAENPLRMQGVVIAYMLTVALLIPASGWVADRFGTKKIFFGAIMLFTLGSLLCALSSSLTMLVGARVIQGLGGALMLPVGRLVVLRAYPRSELVRIMGFITIPGLLGPLLGPTMGGWMVQYLTWHWIFLINIPMGIFGIALTLRYIKEIRETDPPKLDWLGFFLSAICLAALVSGFEAVGHDVMSPVQLLGLIAVGLLCGFWYVRHSRRIDYPIIDLSLMRIPTFAISTLAGNLCRFTVGATPFLLAMLLVVILSPSVFSVIVAIAAVSWPGIARLVRGEFVALGGREFVLASTSLGAGPSRIIFRHLLPNCLSPIIAVGSLLVANAILLESGLSFLGLGDPNVMSWGLLISAGRTSLRTAWWVCTFPGIALLLTVLAINLVGDGLNEAFNPRLRER
ncbi:MAG TPA: MFS transporter [Pseudomonas sp.]|nr:MFS transporter [Pseudomonas sp.]